jgi:hypothetical protein
MMNDDQKENAVPKKFAGAFVTKSDSAGQAAFLGSLLRLYGSFEVAQLLFRSPTVCSFV